MSVGLRDVVDARVALANGQQSGMGRRIDVKGRAIRRPLERGSGAIELAVAKDDALEPRRLAVTRGASGIYNIAEADGAVSTGQAARLRGWKPSRTSLSA